MGPNRTLFGKIGQLSVQVSAGLFDESVDVKQFVRGNWDVFDQFSNEMFAMLTAGPEKSLWIQKFQRFLLAIGEVLSYEFLLFVSVHLTFCICCSPIPTKFVSR